MVNNFKLLTVEFYNSLITCWWTRMTVRKSIDLVGETKGNILSRLNFEIFWHIRRSLGEKLKRQKANLNNLFSSLFHASIE